jgi:hypothetical protein
METTVAAMLAVLMRWTHILCMTILVGGMFYARFAFSPAIAAAAAEEVEVMGERAVAAFRALLLGAMAGVLGSGIFNLITKQNLPHGYHMWFGIKMLLALHIFAVGFLMATRAMTQARRDRLATGAIVTGALVLLISAILRYLTLGSMVPRP